MQRTTITRQYEAGKEGILDPNTTAWQRTEKTRSWTRAVLKPFMRLLLSKSPCRQGVSPEAEDNSLRQGELPVRFTLVL